MPFEGVTWGALSFADIGGDKDFDVLVVRKNKYDTKIAKLYRNLLNTDNIFEIKHENRFKLFPNPSSNVLYINGNIKKEYILEIIDISGQVKYKKQVNISHIETGIYFVKIYNSSYYQINKSIVE